LISQYGNIRSSLAKVIWAGSHATMCGAKPGIHSGGTNPALRTFYHRLVRLLSLSIQPLFVFDGPHKPPFKRGHRTSASTVSLPNFLMKQLLKLFGFPFIVARGEAEAEAALLQREGIVDAVFSEDVDTLMFGCGLSMRNWSSEGSRGNKQPTHVTVYDASKIATGPSGLDREGMVLVALMSGGDYIPEGVPGCGIKVACEAARAGFGKSLLSIPKTDTAGFKTWRDSLAHELRSNSSKFFRVKHNALQLPGTFPNLEVLGYYAQPVVSSAEGIQKLKDEIQWDGEVDIAGLRAFVADAFEWRHKSGAIKFIRGS
jgi:Holliday junction resolvase YEN1